MAINLLLPHRDGIRPETSAAMLSVLKVADAELGLGWVGHAARSAERWSDLRSRLS